jgi:hypothetical protein
MADMIPAGSLQVFWFKLFQYLTLGSKTGVVDYLLFEIKRLMAWSVERGGVDDPYHQK